MVLRGVFKCGGISLSQHRGEAAARRATRPPALSPCLVTLGRKKGRSEIRLSLALQPPTIQPGKNPKPGIGHVANPGFYPCMYRGGPHPGCEPGFRNPGIYQGRPISHIPGFSWLLDHRYRRQATGRGDRPGIRPGMWACACARKSKSYSQPRFTIKA